MKNSGKWVVIGLLAAAVGAAITAVWFQYRATHRALGAWGVQGAYLIRSAPRVELEVLRTSRDGPVSDLSETIVGGSTRTESNGGSSVVAIAQQYLRIAGQLVFVKRDVDLSGAKGIINMRTALLADDSFLWDAPANAKDATWDFALTFSDGTSSKTLVFSLSSGSVWDADRDAPLVMSETLSKGLAIYMAPYLSEDASTDPDSPVEGAQPAAD